MTGNAIAPIRCLANGLTTVYIKFRAIFCYSIKDLPLPQFMYYTFNNFHKEYLPESIKKIHRAIEIYTGISLALIRNNYVDG